MRTIARLDGTPFPSTAKLVSRWFGGRLPALRLPPASGSADRTADGSAGLESAYCAEVVAQTYESMGLLTERRKTNWYDPGRFWSGDRLPLAPGVSIGREIEVLLSDADLAQGRSPQN